MDSPETPTVEAKQEAALDTLFPKPEAGETATEAPPASPGVVTEVKEPKLHELITSLQSAIKSRIDGMNAKHTADGSAPGVNTHGTRLHSAARVVQGELEHFKNFLLKEGHE